MLFYAFDKALRVSKLASDNIIWQVTSNPQHHVVGKIMLQDYVKYCLDKGMDFHAVRVYDI